MTNFHRYFFLSIILFTIVAAARGQSITDEIERARSHHAHQANENTEEPSDPLGRSTPHGTVFGFLQATQNGHYRDAAQYLQLSRNERAFRGERLARQLHELMDDTFVGRVGAISDEKTGSAQVDIPKDHERIGVFRIDGNETNVDLVRVDDPSSGEIWLFSSQVVNSVPDLYDQIEGNQMESRLPGFLVTRRFLSTPLWRLIAFLLLIPVSIMLAWLSVKLARGGLHIWLRWRHQPELDNIPSLVKPAVILLAVGFHQLGVYFLDIPLLVRVYYQRLCGLIIVAGFAWLIFQLINRWAERARVKALAGSGYRNGSIILLGQRILNVLVIVVAILIMLTILGFDTTTAVAGLGIGSIAIAFAAQKTLENLLGGISILGDQVIRVGENCRIGGREGTVEDISLRSTRIRTLERTELSVPNGELANMNVENISRRDKSLFQEKIGLRRETPPDLLRSLLEQMRALLEHDASVDRQGARVRFIGFGESSLDIEIHCFILTSTLSEFLAIRENLLLQIMDIVSKAGAGLAFPTRTLLLTQKIGPQQAERAEKTSDIRRVG
jgi:MscS family membrane protein